MTHNIYTILFYVGFPFLILLSFLIVDFCLCVSWLRQHQVYRKWRRASASAPECADYDC